MVEGDEVSVLANDLYAMHYLNKFIVRAKLHGFDAGILQFPKGKAPKKGGRK